MEFVALDFETANARPDSACQLGLVRVVQGRMVREGSWLIRPDPFYFSPGCVAVHGIQPADVEQAPSWDQLWGELAEWFTDQVLVAHNARFDMNVLRGTLLRHDLAVPPLEFTCTRAVARLAWPGQMGYGLKPLAARLGIVFRHHDALEDARACATLMLQAAEQLGVDSLEQLETQLGLSRGRLWHDRLVSPRASRRRSSVTMSQKAGESGAAAPLARGGARRGESSEATKLEAREQLLAGLIEAGAAARPLASRRVCVIGELLGLNQQQVAELIAQLGGELQLSLGPDTQLVITGGESNIGRQATAVRGADRSAAEVAARSEPTPDDPLAGRPVRVISGRQLLALIPGGLQLARQLSGAL
jgi:DNA polymerase III subunit epsilon